MLTPTKYLHNYKWVTKKEDLKSDEVKDKLGKKREYITDNSEYTVDEWRDEAFGGSCGEDFDVSTGDCWAMINRNNIPAFKVVSGLLVPSKIEVVMSALY